MSKEKLSFVIPCYRSENTVLNVIQEIRRVLLQRPQYSYEIITVNDCSPDNVLGVLTSYANTPQNHDIKVIDLAKNVGKHAALMAGFSFACGDIVIGLDDDGQCPLDKLWDLISPLINGAYDIAIASYPQKKQSFLKNAGSRVNDLMACFLLGKPKDLKLSNFFACKKFVCKEMLKYQNPYPYVDGLFLRTTSKIANVSMEERDRLYGTSGYTFIRSLKLWLNGFTAFSVKPLRIATAFGMVISVVGVFVALYTIICKLLNPEILAGYSSLMAVLLIIGGIIMMLLGLIGEYVGRIYISINNSPQYVIRDALNCEDPAGQ